MNQLIKFVRFLDEARLVANVQRFFGIQIVDVIPETLNTKDASKFDLVNHQTQSKKQRQKIHDHEKKNEYREVRISTDSRKCVYKINNPIVYWFFLFVTHLGQEIFYILFLPM